VEHETVVSMLGRALFGRGAFYYLIQAATALILILAANTSFAGFPRLASLLSQDRYAPRQFAKRGDRLVFSNGIVILGAFAALLIIAFRGDTHALIPLYALVADQLSLEGYGGPPPIRHTVLVPIGDVHRGVVAAVQYAKLLSPEAKAVYVETDPAATRALEEKWIKWGMGVPLVILTSP